MRVVAESVYAIVASAGGGLSHNLELAYALLQRRAHLLLFGGLLTIITHIHPFLFHWERPFLFHLHIPRWPSSYLPLALAPPVAFASPS